MEAKAAPQAARIGKHQKAIGGPCKDGEVTLHTVTFGDFMATAFPQATPMQMLPSHPPHYSLHSATCCGLKSAMRGRRSRDTLRIICTIHFFFKTITVRRRTTWQPRIMRVCAVPTPRAKRAPVVTPYVSEHLLDECCYDPLGSLLRRCLCSWRTHWRIKWQM